MDLAAPICEAANGAESSVRVRPRFRQARSPHSSGVEVTAIYFVGDHSVHYDTKDIGLGSLQEVPGLDSVPRGAWLAETTINTASTQLASIGPSLKTTVLGVSKSTRSQCSCSISTISRIFSEPSSSEGFSG